MWPADAPAIWARNVEGAFNRERSASLIACGWTREGEAFTHARWSGSVTHPRALALEAAELVEQAWQRGLDAAEALARRGGS